MSTTKILLCFFLVKMYSRFFLRLPAIVFRHAWCRVMGVRHAHSLGWSFSEELEMLALRSMFESSDNSAYDWRLYTEHVVSRRREKPWIQMTRVEHGTTRGWLLGCPDTMINQEKGTAATEGADKPERGTSILGTGMRKRSGAAGDGGAQDADQRTISESAAADKSIDALVIYVHGGAFVVGSPLFFLPFWEQVLRSLESDNSTGSPSIQMFGVQYPLSPEAPHPAALDAVVDAYVWAVTNSNIQAKNIILVGDSAGGNLALAAAQQLHDHHPSIRRPSSLLLISPLPNLSSRAIARIMTAANRHFDFLDADKIACFNIAYVGGNVQQLASPSVSPYLWEGPWNELVESKKVVVMSGGSEMLAEDIAELVEKMRSGELVVDHHCAECMPHSYMMLWPALKARSEVGIRELSQRLKMLAEA